MGKFIIIIVAGDLILLLCADSEKFLSILWEKDGEKLTLFHTFVFGMDFDTISVTVIK